jgi:hypothetical protein
LLLDIENVFFPHLQIGTDHSTPCPTGCGLFTPTGTPSEEVVFKGKASKKYSTSGIFYESAPPERNFFFE